MDGKKKVRKEEQEKVAKGPTSEISSWWWDKEAGRKFPEVLTTLKIQLQLPVFYLLDCVAEMICMKQYHALFQTNSSSFNVTGTRIDSVINVPV